MNDRDVASNFLEGLGCSPQRPFLTTNFQLYVSMPQPNYPQQFQIYVNIFTYRCAAFIYVIHLVIFVLIITPKRNGVQDTQKNHKLDEWSPLSIREENCINLHLEWNRISTFLFCIVFSFSIHSYFYSYYVDLKKVVEKWEKVVIWFSINKFHFLFWTFFKKIFLQFLCVIGYLWDINSWKLELNATRFLKIIDASLKICATKWILRRFKISRRRTRIVPIVKITAPIRIPFLSSSFPVMYAYHKKPAGATNIPTNKI